MVQTPRRSIRVAILTALYDRLARQYDTISRLGFAGEWSRWQAVALGFVDRRPIVELGCGTGHTLATLHQRGLPAYGIDLARPMLTQARSRANGALLQAQVQRLPLRDQSVGTLLSLFPTHYILDPATWSEAARVLQPGGRLIILDHGWLGPTDPWRLALLTAHRLFYGVAAGPPPFAPTPPPDPAAMASELPHGILEPTVALVERTPHGFVSVHIATKPAYSPAPLKTGH